MIRVSFSLFLSLSVFCCFTLLLIFIKNYFIIIIILFIYFHENYFYFFMFRDVPGCSGMFRHVPECSMFRILSTPLHAQPFKLRRGQYVNFIALRKYNFLDFFCFAYKIFAVTILNIIPLTERTFQSRMLTFLRKRVQSPVFCETCYRFT